ncbi:protein of unknown function [Bradyrhizobium vignae]|uniref:Uncharacterized protein n=1 Tax=Bradyrhizobium vignae TaxID=1549949 RepID=A0A2U3Q771_9BRAD|nr:protein of unknown function [Bradyrhizobium vignae]
MYVGVYVKPIRFYNPLFFVVKIDQIGGHSLRHLSLGAKKSFEIHRDPFEGALAFLEDLCAASFELSRALVLMLLADHAGRLKGPGERPRAGARCCSAF